MSHENGDESGWNPVKELERVFGEEQTEQLKEKLDEDQFREIAARERNVREHYFEPMGIEGIEKASELVEGFQNVLRSDWRRYREKSYNPNTKGAVYETALKNFLKRYFGTILDFKTRSAIVDSELRCFSVLSEGKNEIDLVSTYRTATPNVVFELEEMSWIPYNAVAFLCEVKSSITKSSLEDDMEKLRKLKEIRPDPTRRFTDYSGTQNVVNHQLLCLVYDDNDIADRTRRSIFEDYRSVWDMVLIIEDDKLYLNSALPVSDNIFRFERKPKWIHINNGLLWFVIALSVTLPYPIGFSVTDPILKMAGIPGMSVGGAEGFESS